MKFFLLALSWLLLFENLQGSTLPHGRPVRALNTTLRTNFSGIYQRKNPCSGTDIETSSYKASHELHHHTKDDSWSDYTHKCSAIIRNFLQTIGNLIRFNHEPSGSFNFYLNTSICQKQRLSGNLKSCESLPTIVIEATDCNIPLGPCCQVPKGRSVKHKDVEDRKSPKDLPLPADFPSQQDSRSQKGVPVSDIAQIPNDRLGAFPTEKAVTAIPLQYITSKSTTQSPGRGWSEESSCEDDDSSVSSQPASEFKFPTPFSPSGEITEPEDISQAVLHDLSRDTQSAYEPKTKYFKTSLRLTPQTDPENGTIQPRIHYMAANLVADPSHCEPAPQSETENSFPRPGGPGPLLTTPFPEGPYQPIEGTSLPSEDLPQVPLSAVVPSLQSYASRTEPIQISAIARPEPQFSFPSSRTEALPKTTAAPAGKPFSTSADPLPLRPAPLFTDPSTDFTPEIPPAVNWINDPQSSSARAIVDYDPKISKVQSTTSAPQPFHISSPPNSLSADQNQSEEGLLLPPSQRPQGAIDSSLKLEPETPTFSDRTPNFGSQLSPFVSRQNQFDARQISPQRFPAQLPHDSGLPSTILPPSNSFETYEQPTSLTTQPPSFQSEFEQLPNDPDLVPGESKEESNGVSVSPPSQPSIIPYGENLPPRPMPSTPPAGLPYSDSFITPSPALDEEALPVGSPVNFDFTSPNPYTGQWQTSDDQSTKRFKSSSVTTVVEEDTVISNQEQTTPQFRLDAAAEQIPQSTSPSGPDFSPYVVPQQFPSVLPDYLQAQTAGAGPFTNSNVRDDSQPLINPDRPTSSLFQITPENPEDAPKSEPADFRPEAPFSNVGYSAADPQISNAAFSSKSDQVPTVPETSQISQAPFREESQSLEPIPAPEYDLRTDGSLYVTTPMPYAPILNPEKPASDSPIASEGKPPFPYATSSSATAATNYSDAGLATTDAYAPPTQQTYPLGEYNFQTSSQQLLFTPKPADEPPIEGPLVGYSDQIGIRAPPASDSFVRGDSPTAAVTQPFTSNVGGFPASTPDNSLTYDSASLGQFPDSSQQERPPVNFENGPPAAPAHSDSLGPQLSSGALTTDSEQIFEPVSPDLFSFVTPPPEEYALRPEQQPLVSTSSRISQESFPSPEQFSTDETSRLSSGSAITGGPEAVLSQELLGNDPNRRTNPAEVFSATATYTEQNFQTPSQSTTPVYATHSPAEADSENIFQPQILRNKSGQRNPANLLGSLEHFSSGKQTKETTDSTAPLRPLSFPGNSDLLPPTLPSPNTFSGYVDATTPADLPPSAEHTNQEFVLNSPSASPDSFVTSLPAGERFSEITPGKPDFQQSSPNSELLPLSPALRSPHWNDDFNQTPSPSPLMTTSSTEDRSADSLPSRSVDTYAFSLPQDAEVTPSTDSPTKYTLPPTLQTADIATIRKDLREEPQFYTTPQPEPPQPTPPIQPLHKSTQTTPQQPSDSAPPISIASQARSSDLLIQSPLEAPEYFFQRPLPSETNLVRPPTDPMVGPAADEIIPRGAHPGKTVVQYEEEETTTYFTPQSFGDDLMSTKPPQAFDGTSSGPQPYVNPPVASNPQSVDIASNLQETAILSRKESEPNDFDQNPNTFPVAEEQKDRTFYQTVSIEERTVTDSTQLPLPEPPQTLPESTAAGEIITVRQQSFPPPNYADRTSLESSNFFVPLVRQQIPTPNVQTPATTHRSVESHSPQEIQGELHPFHFSSIPPPSSESLTRNEGSGLSQVNSNFQDRVQRLPETFAPENLHREPDGSDNQRRPEPLPQFINRPMYDPYNGNLAAPPRAPLSDRYPGPNYMQNPLPDSPGNRPPFYAQQPMPQITNLQPPPSPPLNLSPKPLLIAQQVATSETTSQSSGPQTQPRLPRPDAPFHPDGQLATSAEGPPAPAPPPYLQNLPGPDGLMPPLDSPHPPNYNAFRPEQPSRYFPPPPSLPYSVNNDPRLQLQNQPNLPLYPDVRMNTAAPFQLIPLRDQRPVPPQINQIMDDGRIDNLRENYPTLRPNSDADPGREVDVLTNGQTLPQQTEDRPPVDSRPGLPIHPETASHPYPLPPGPPTSPVIPPPPAQENPLPNPFLQALQSHLVIPTQEHPHQPTSLPGRSDQNEQLSFDTKNNSPAVPPYPGRWNPRPATNFVNLQQNTPLDAPRGVPNRPQPHPHALLPHQTTPSNEPDPASTGRSDYVASPLRDSFYADRMRSGSGPERF